VIAWIVPGSAALLVVIALAFALVCVRRAEHAASRADASARNAKSHATESRTLLHRVEGMVTAFRPEPAEHPSQPPAADVVPVVVQTTDPEILTRPGLVRDAVTAYLGTNAAQNTVVTPERLRQGLDHITRGTWSPEDEARTVADRARREP
jgi:hypothetical protein